MKLLSFFTVAVSAQYTNWNWWQSYIHLHYKGRVLTTNFESIFRNKLRKARQVRHRSGGIANFIRDDLTDRGFPAEFVNLWENATDATILGSVASWTDSDKSDFEDETTAGRNLFTFYANKINAAASQAIDRDTLEAIVYTDFLANQIPADLDLDTLMADIVAENFDVAVENAQDWAEKMVDAANFTWTTDPGAEGHVAVIQAWKRAMASYGNAVNLKKSAAAVVNDYAQIGQQIVQASLLAWEAQTDTNYIFNIVYEKLANTMEDVFLTPIFQMCEKEVGPFAMLNLMSVNLYEVVAYLETFMEFDDETTEQFSMLFFGDTEHVGFDYPRWLEDYVLYFFDEFSGTGDIQARIHLMSMLFDEAIFPTVYSIVSCPICGICDQSSGNSTAV